MIALTRRNPKLFKISDVYMPPTIRDYPSLLWSLAAGRQRKDELRSAMGASRSFGLAHAGYFVIPNI